MKIGRPSIPFVYRNRSRGWAMGVCAGLHEITGVKAWLLRASLVAATLFYPLIMVVGYVLLTLCMQDRAEPDSELDGAMAASKTRSDRIAAFQEEYDQIQQRVTTLETEAFSREAELRRRFKDAGLV